MQRAWDWMREAQAEPAAARSLYEARHWAWCCFTCQQAAERAPESVRSGCARLNRYGVPTRYPNAFDRGVPAEQFFEDDARRWVDRLAEWEDPEGRVDVFCCGRSEWQRMFEDRHLLMLDALEWGVVLYDRGSFQRMRETFRRWRVEGKVVPWRCGWRMA